MHSDASNGWDTVSDAFIAHRRRSLAGAKEVARWAASLPQPASVLDVACGCGEPLTRVLLDHRCEVFAIDASPRMLEALRRDFPSVRTACETVEHSSFFNRTFDGVLAWGLLFLLPEPSQEATLHKLARTLAPGGSLLFTSPIEAAHWLDATTGRLSASLGFERYTGIVNAAGLTLISTFHDADGNHYYHASRPTR
jgi:2-polyprenyl-3-methyl-5-hydroxy-6-metoxy-1,4-benzoquinol methylase